MVNVNVLVSKSRKISATSMMWLQGEITGSKFKIIYSLAHSSGIHNKDHPEGLKS